MVLFAHVNMEVVMQRPIKKTLAIKNEIQDNWDEYFATSRTMLLSPSTLEDGIFPDMFELILVEKPENGWRQTIFERKEDKWHLVVRLMP